jgi:hypothetical protein
MVEGIIAAVTWPGKEMGRRPPKNDLGVRVNYTQHNSFEG